MFVLVGFCVVVFFVFFYLDLKKIASSCLLLSSPSLSSSSSSFFQTNVKKGICKYINKYSQRRRMHNVKGCGMCTYHRKILVYKYILKPHKKRFKLYMYI